LEFYFIGIKAGLTLKCFFRNNKCLVNVLKVTLFLVMALKYQAFDEKYCGRFLKTIPLQNEIN